MNLWMISWLDRWWSMWMNCIMEWIMIKSCGSRWSLNCDIFCKNNLSLSLRIIYLILDHSFQVYHVATTNIDLAELIFVSRLDIFISLGKNNKFINAFVVIHIVWNQFAIFDLENPFSIFSLWINLDHNFVPWV